jgi:hypothetical protein
VRNYLLYQLEIQKTKVLSGVLKRVPTSHIENAVRRSLKPISDELRNEMLRDSKFETTAAYSADSHVIFILDVEYGGVEVRKLEFK